MSGSKPRQAPHINVNELFRRVKKTTLGAGPEPNSLPKLAFRAPMKEMQPPGKNHDKSVSIHHTVFPKITLVDLQWF